MTGRGQCLVLLLFSAILLLDSHKSHRKLPPEAPVAFVRYTAPRALVRLEGEFHSAGIHKIPDGATLMDVINMAVPKVFPKVADRPIFDTQVSSGDIVTFSRKAGQEVEITFGKMKARERILLGMPLCLDQMGYTDWLELPGIGPGLAAAIIKYRQINGDFDGVEELQRVPGIGMGKASQLISIF